MVKKATARLSLIRGSDIPQHVILVVILIIRDVELPFEQCNIHIHISIFDEGGIGLGQAVITLEQLTTYKIKWKGRKFSEPCPHLCPHTMGENCHPTDEQVGPWQNK